MPAKPGIQVGSVGTSAFARVMRLRQGRSSPSTALRAVPLPVPGKLYMWIGLPVTAIAASLSASL